MIRAPARKAEDPGSNPGSGVICSLKLTTKNLPDCYSENQIFKFIIIGIPKKKKARKTATKYKNGILASIGNREMTDEDWVDRKLWRNKTVFGMRIPMDLKKTLLK